MDAGICSRCVMDTSDPEIQFDANGNCNHCTNALSSASTHWQWHPDEKGALILEEKLSKIREAGRGKEFDCIIGLSGGVDSSYLAYKSREWNLRPLLFHVDGGWNTPESENNINNIASFINAPLRKYTVNWEEMRDLQRAFLQAGVPNQDIPQDHLFFAVLFSLAQKMRIRYWLTGSNFVSESILPASWGYNAMDVRHLLDIHKRFGTVPLKTFPKFPLTRYFQYYAGLGFSFVKSVDPLNWIPYDVAEARKELAEQCGWQSYGRKHCESIFTRYFQCHYLPRRFGFDKRKAHYSSLIVSGQMTRKQALEALAEPLYDTRQLVKDTAYLSQKLGYTQDAWDALLETPRKKHCDYLVSTGQIHLVMRLKTLQNAVVLLLQGKFSIFYLKFKNKIIKLIH